MHDGGRSLPRPFQTADGGSRPEGFAFDRAAFVRAPSRCLVSFFAGTCWLSLRCVGVLLSVIRAPTLSRVHLLAFLSIARILRDTRPPAAFQSAEQVINTVREMPQYGGHGRLEPVADTADSLSPKNGESGISISRRMALTTILPRFLRTAVSMLKSSASCFDRRFSILSSLLQLSSMLKEAPCPEVILLLDALSDAVDRCVADIRRESGHAPHTRLPEGRPLPLSMAPVATKSADQALALPGMSKPRYSHACLQATWPDRHDSMEQAVRNDCRENLLKTSGDISGTGQGNRRLAQDSSQPFPTPVRGWTAAAVAAATCERNALETKAAVGALTQKALPRRWDLCARAQCSPAGVVSSTVGSEAGAQRARTDHSESEGDRQPQEGDGAEWCRQRTTDTAWWPPGDRSFAEKELCVIFPLLEVLLAKLPERISEYSRRTAQQIHELLQIRRCCPDTFLAERALLTLQRCGTALRPTVGPQLHVLAQLCTVPGVSSRAAAFPSSVPDCFKWPSPSSEDQLGSRQQDRSPSLNCGCCCCSPAPLGLRLAVLRTIQTLLTCCGFPLLIGAIVRRLMDALRCSQEDCAPLELRQHLLNIVGTIQQQFPTEAGPYARLLSKMILSSGSPGSSCGNARSAAVEQEEHSVSMYHASGGKRDVRENSTSLSRKGGPDQPGDEHGSERHSETPCPTQSLVTRGPPRWSWACAQDASVDAVGVRSCSRATAYAPSAVMAPPPSEASGSPSGVQRTVGAPAFWQSGSQQKQGSDAEANGLTLLQAKRPVSTREGQRRQAGQLVCVPERSLIKEAELADGKRRRRSSARTRARGRGGPRPSRPQTAADLWKHCDL